MKGREKKAVGRVAGVVEREVGWPFARNGSGKEGNDAGEERDVMRGGMGEKVDIGGTGREGGRRASKGNTARRRAAN